MLQKTEFANMEILSNYKISPRDCLASIGSIETKFTEEKMLLWSASVSSKLSYSNLRDCFVFVGRSFAPKNIKCKAILWASSVSSYIKDNPIVFSLPTGNRIGEDGLQTYVNLPYLGAVSLDIFLFTSSAIVSRAYMFWRSQQQAPGIVKDGATTGNATIESVRPELHTVTPSPPVKSTIVKGFKDKSLYKTIKECQDVKKVLRRVEDPDLARKEKKMQLALQNVRCKIKGKNSSDGYLGMSPGTLQDARKFLKRVAPDQRLQ